MRSLRRPTPRAVLRLRLGLVACVALLASTQVHIHGPVHAQSTDPCEGISIKPYVAVAAERWTTDANFDATLPADRETISTGNDAQYMFPLGYRKAVIYEDNMPPFCIRVDGVFRRKVEVMVQTVQPQARLCIKDYGVGFRQTGSVARCFNDRTTACFDVQYQQPMVLVFYCEGGCQTGFTSFWYRIRKSNVDYDNVPYRESATQSLEMWCMMQDQLPDGTTRFPDDLITNITPDMPAQAQQASDAYATAHGSTAWMAVLSGALVAIMQWW